jgi:predicted DsbA family dithiol-disulfide isomerase
MHSEIFKEIHVNGNPSGGSRSERYRIEGVPTFVVNGKYVADVRSAGGPDRLLALVNDFAAQEHKH